MSIIGYIYPFLITSILLLMLIRYPVALSIPSDRGLHNRPIATSGGLAIFLGISTILITTLNTNLIVLLILASMITFTGLLDDKYNLSVTTRFIIQIMLFIIFFGYNLIDMTKNAYIFILFVFISTYMINIFNFMDGIDLLATLQTIFTFAALQIILYNDISTIPNIIEIMNFTIITLASFLLFNKSPAKIFLGNSGSYLLGFLIISVFYLIITNNSSHLIPVLIIFTVFLCDSTYTLIARFINQFRSDNSFLYKKFTKSVKILSRPHKTHLYQKLAQKYECHGKVNLHIMSYNLVWCFPLASFSYNFEEYAFYLLIISYIPYILWCYSMKAGVATDYD